MNLKLGTVAAISASALALSACCTTGPYEETSPMTESSKDQKRETDNRTFVAPVNVQVEKDGSGGYTFVYSGPFADKEGNLDFSRGKAEGRSVLIQFNIAEDSVPGLQFRPKGRDAIWITRGSQEFSSKPQGPYREDLLEGRVRDQGKAQFRDFRTSKGGQELNVFNQNDDSGIYVYNLRFDLGDELVVHDPEIKNGGGHN